MDEETVKDGIETIRKAIISYPDFPKPGILFRDVFPIFENHETMSLLFSIMIDYLHTTYPKIDYIVGLEARGFILAPILATRLGAGFIPIRKCGKLPGKTVKKLYSLEYGQDALEIRDGLIKPGQSVVIVDDLLATAGTMKAAVELLTEVGAKILECFVIIELVELGGRAKLTEKLNCLIKF